MDLDKQYFLHSRAGRIGDGDLSTMQDLQALLVAMKAAPQKHLIIHFHGGLVPKESGFEIAKKLLSVYQDGGHPVFFIWESGAWETIRNNITELADEPVFKQLLRKLLEYALRRLGVTDGARSIAPRQVDPEEVKRTLERYIRDPRPETVPYKGFVPFVPADQARSAADAVDVNEIEIDLQNDQDFCAALATLPDIPADARGSLPDAAPRDTPFSHAVSARVSRREGQRGPISFFKVASLLVTMLVGLLRRYHKGRDHGLYATAVEELLRAFKLGGSGLNEWGKALEWNRMKKDCDDAFGPDPLNVGTAFLSTLREEFNGGRDLRRITLIGHSTGAVYICAWIEAAARVLASEVQFDIVLLAPAVTYQRFATMLSQHEGRIRTFRMFAMSDALERDDQVWGDDSALPRGQDWRRFIYPSSLLYLVSGILESKTGPGGGVTDEPDMPLLGMQRFYSERQVYDDGGFPEVAQVRNWLGKKADTLVWSFADNVGAGRNCHCNDHGAFDDEPITLASLRYIVTQGF